MDTIFPSDLFLQIITTGRLWSILAGLIGLSGVIIGRLALVRSSRGISSARNMGMAALGVGLASIIVSGVHLASTSGSIGQGKGIAGAIIALVLGLIGAVMGVVSLRRRKL